MENNIKRQLKDYLLSGADWRPPTIRSVCAKFGISEGTAFSVYREVFRTYPIMPKIKLRIGEDVKRVSRDFNKKEMTLLIITKKL